MYRSSTDKVTNFRVLNDAEAVAHAVADYLLERISACVIEKGICHVVLPGGSTPARCMELLAGMPLSWDRIHWYPGDERCYPKGHEDRNDVMIYRCLFSRPDNVVENFHPIPAELGAGKATRMYTKFIDGIRKIDIAVLGMGEDGHTASLFPGNPALDSTDSIVAVYDSPKPPPERVSFGLQTLRHAGETILIATGSNKREAMAKFESGEPIPVTMVEPDICFVDTDTRDD